MSLGSLLTKALLGFMVAATAPAFAQPPQGPELDEATRAELARLGDEALAHDNAGRYALAAQSYQELYEGMRRVNHPRASVALWNRGLVLMEISGREREARQAIEQFLEESIALSEDPSVARFRSQAPVRLAEIDARIAGTPVVEERRPAEDDSARPERNDDSLSPAGPILMGAGGGVLVAATIVGILALVKDSDLFDRCGGTACLNTAENHDAYDAMRQLAVAADVLFVSGALLAVGGLVVTLATIPGDDDEVTARLRMRPGVGADLLQFEAEF